MADTPAGAPPSSAKTWIVYLVVVAAYAAWIAPHLRAATDPDRKPPEALAATPDEVLEKLTADAAVLQTAKETFRTSCAACHGEEGQGLVGPNLTDGFWLHGARPADIHRIIAVGVVEKGMPGWELALGREKVDALAAYVLTLKGRNVPGKPPQGQPAE